MPELENQNEQKSFFEYCEAETHRKEKLLAAFEKIGKRERRRLHQAQDSMAARKYERVTRGLFLVEKVNKTYIHLKSENGMSFGILESNPEIAALLKSNDALQGLFGYRDGCWRPQFLFSIQISAADFLSPPWPSH